MTNNLSKYFAHTALFLIFLLLPAYAQAAPKLYFDPSSVNAVQNSEFTIQLKIDAETNKVIGSDVVVSYAGGDLDVTSVTTGGFFPEFQYADSGTGRIELHAYVTSIYQTKTGAGTLATLKFKSNKNAGSSSLSVTCSGSGNDTNILNDSGQNILSCSSVNQVAIIYSGSSANTPTPTTQPGSTSTPTPTNASYNTYPTCTGLSASITSAVGTPLAVTFSCSGTDSDGYVNAAEFMFGDGTKQVIEKNIGGQGGSISTTHTYTTIGTLGAFCRVRDNNNVYSSTPSGCKQNIVIKPKPTNAPSTGGTSVSTATHDSGITDEIVYTQATTTPKPTPTTPVVSIISVTPLPTLALYPSATLYPDDTTPTQSPSRFWWIVGAAASLLVAWLLLRKKKPPKPPTTSAPTPVPPIIIRENTSPPAEPPPAN